MNSSFRANVPQLFVDVDRDKVKRRRLPITDVFSTLQANLGGHPQKHSRPEWTGAASRAGDRDRTDDIQLGKLTFYH